jgi:uncharacterized protein (UPF0333 family)
VKKWRLVILIVLLAGVAGGIYAWREYNRRAEGTSDLKAIAAKQAGELVKEFEADENKANTAYNDKVVSVQGTIVKVERNDSTQTVILAGESAMAGVVCQFEPEQNKRLEALKPGQAIKIKGVCTGALMDVILVRCVLDE